jgi:hypothetical protein
MRKNKLQNSGYIKKTVDEIFLEKDLNICYFKGRLLKRLITHAPGLTAGCLALTAGSAGG